MTKTILIKLQLDKDVWDVFMIKYFLLYSRVIEMSWLSLSYLYDVWFLFVMRIINIIIIIDIIILCLKCIHAMINAERLIGPRAVADEYSIATSFLWPFLSTNKHNHIGLKALVFDIWNSCTFMCLVCFNVLCIIQILFLSSLLPNQFCWNRPLIPTVWPSLP